jgi:hypothetical protein
MLGIHPELITPMPLKSIVLPKTPIIKQQVNAFSGGQLPLGVLLFDAGSTATF